MSISSISSDRVQSPTFQPENSLHVEGQLIALHEALDEMRQCSIAKYIKKADAREKQLVEQSTKALIQGIVALPLLRISKTDQQEQVMRMCESLQALFNPTSSRTT